MYLAANLCVGCRPPISCPECPAELHSQESTEKLAPGAQSPTSVLGHDTASQGDRWASQQLAVDGEEVTGKVKLPQYLLLARTMLAIPLGKQQTGLPMLAKQPLLLSLLGLYVRRYLVCCTTKSFLQHSKDTAPWLQHTVN